MAIIFYDHLIDNSIIEIHLDSLRLKPKRKSRIRKLIDDTIHAGLLEFILQQLHPHHHRTFLSQLDQAPYDPELLTYLKNHIDEKIDEAIKKESQRLQKLILKDLKI